MSMANAVASVARALCTLIGAAVRHISQRRRRRRQRPLRCCPICHADAIVAEERSSVDELQVQVALQCGQCGTWRRQLTTHAELGRHDRERERDRRAIGACVARLDVERTLSDVNFFVHALRGDLVGAEDFLARTQRPR